MPPLLILVLVFIFLFGLFWGGTLIAQGYLYQQPTGQLPARAAVAAALVGSFLAGWVMIDKKNPGKYDTFFEFAPYSTTTFNEFQAVRWQADPVAAVKGKQDFKKDEKGNPVEKVSKFKRGPGAKAPFTEEGTGKAFVLNDADIMTAAIILKPDEGASPTRFNAVLRKDARTGALTYPPKGDEKRRFEEENGSRYVLLDQPGVLYVPSTGVVVGALALNFLLFVVWFVAFWPVLRFSWGHALGLTAMFGLVTMLVVMPLLFKPNRQKPGPVAAAGMAIPGAVSAFHPV